MPELTTEHLDEIEGFFKEGEETIKLSKYHKAEMQRWVFHGYPPTSKTMTDALRKPQYPHPSSLATEEGRVKSFVAYWLTSVTKWQNYDSWERANGVRGWRERLEREQKQKDMIEYFKTGRFAVLGDFIPIPQDHVWRLLIEVPAFKPAYDGWVRVANLIKAGTEPQSEVPGEMELELVG